jgi:hypothetical protein
VAWAVLKRLSNGDCETADVALTARNPQITAVWAYSKVSPQLGAVRTADVHCPETAWKVREDLLPWQQWLLASSKDTFSLVKHPGFLPVHSDYLNWA